VSVAECVRVEKERLGRGRGACRKDRGREGRYTFVRRDPGQEEMRGDGAVGWVFCVRRRVLCVWTIDCPQQKALKKKRNDTWCFYSNVLTLCLL
jgi:hypothetical protein